MLLLLVLAAAPGSSVDVLFTGDVIPHESVKDTARSHAREGLNHDGWDHVFGPLTEAFRRADVAVVNLETPITTRTTNWGEMVFAARPSMVKALAAVGVTVATFANNHARDQELEGIVDTRKHLDKAGLLSVGAAKNEKEAWKPLCFDRNGLKLCFIAFTRFLNGQQNEADEAQPHVPIVEYSIEGYETKGISERELLKKVRKTAKQCDALFVTPHWGEEYYLEPLQTDRRLAYALIEAGAVAVIGNHPHVLQSIETYSRADGREGLIAFSLGNLVSSQGADDMDTRRDGLLLSLTVSMSEAGATVSKTRALPVWTDNRGKAGIQPVLADEEIGAMRERVRLLEGRNDAASRNEIAALSARLSKATSRRERILSLVPTEMYESQKKTELASEP